MSRRKIQISDQSIIDAAKVADSALKAAVMLNVKFSTYKRHATRLGVYKTNQSGKGLLKNRVNGSISLSEILDGLHPSYQTSKLRIRLIKENIKEAKCECCGISEWLGKNLSLELDHIDGNRYNHKLHNLRILCPNCHSQTDSYRGKNKSKCPGDEIGSHSGLKTHSP